MKISIYVLTFYLMTPSLSADDFSISCQLPIPPPELLQQAQFSAPGAIAAPAAGGAEIPSFITIYGGETMRTNVLNALNFMLGVAPEGLEGYTMITDCKSAIKGIAPTNSTSPPNPVGGGNYSNFTGTIWVNANGSAYGASILIHEAAHINMFGWGCSQEAQTLEYQAKFLDRAGQGGLADWLRCLKNCWGCGAGTKTCQGSPTNCPGSSPGGPLADRVCTTPSPDTNPPTPPKGLKKR